MSQATPEEIKAENDFYDRLTNAVTESLLTLPTKDLNQWNFRAMLFTQCDTIIANLLESAKGRPQIGRFYLCLLLYRICSRLLNPIEGEHCGKTDGAVVREAMKRYEAVSSKAPAGKPKARPLSQKYDAILHRNRRANMTPEQLTAFRARAAELQRARRARLKLAGG